MARKPTEGAATAAASSTAASKKHSLGKVLIIGGCGFLGHHLVSQLLESYSCQLAVLDLRTERNRRPESDGVRYFEGDITSLASILPVFEEFRPDVVIHTASPNATSHAASPAAVAATDALFRKVNVEGTRCVIEACRKVDVASLVYTSSASIIHDMVGDLINADERWPVLGETSQKSYYALTKAQAEELVLAANRQPGSRLLTCAIRPAGIFGEGDIQLLPNMIELYRSKKTGFQIGDNTNMFDFTYVGNVAHAHILASLALTVTGAAATPQPDEKDRIDGEAFLITNDAPTYFWDFPRMVWRIAGSPLGTEHVWVIDKELGVFIAGVLETVMWLLRMPPLLTRYQVKYSCMTRYYDISKAKQRLGYLPIVSLEEGLRRSIRWFEEELDQKEAKKTQ